MDAPDAISSHLPSAVVAAVVIALFSSYLGEITTVQGFLVDFVLHVVALFAGFVAVDAVWNRTVLEGGT